MNRKPRKLTADLERAKTPVTSLAQETQSETLRTRRVPTERYGRAKFHLGLGLEPGRDEARPYRSKSL